jgi:hypothetical protein
MGIVAKSVPVPSDPVIIVPSGVKAPEPLTAWEKITGWPGVGVRIVPQRRVAE